MIIHFDATLTKIDRHVADAGLGYLAVEPEIDVLTSKASPIRLPEDSFPRTQVIARGQALLRPWVIKGLLSRLLISTKGAESALQTVISKSIWTYCMQHAVNFKFYFWAAVLNEQAVATGTH